MRTHLSRLADHRFGRFAVVGVVCATTMLAGQLVAAAHVSVTPDSVVPGEPATVAFRVPNERDDASTVRVEVVFPTDQPLAVATPKAVSGWTVDVTTTPAGEPIDTGHGTATEAVSSIVWTGGEILPGTYEEFPVRIRMPDEPGTLVFKALQTYSGGEVVRWIDVAEEGQPEPEHPAPAVTVAAPLKPSTAEESTSDTAALVLGGAGLVAGLAALAVVTWGGRRRVPAPQVTQRREKARV
jgi:uncharacterized protein YcnI